MADFRLRTDTTEWFAHIERKPPLRTLFDLYYLCALLGIASRRRSDPRDSGNAPVFVQHVIDEYRPQELLIAGLLLRAELAHYGYDLSDREAVQAQLASLVGPGGISDQGAETLNQYASGGFDLLQERYGEAKPETTAQFLPKYVELLAEAIGDEPIWLVSSG
jgi:hypothetical protein